MAPDLIPRFRVIIGEKRQIAGFDFAPDMEFFYRFLRHRARSQESESVRDQIKSMGRIAEELSEVNGLYSIYSSTDETKQWLNSSTFGLGIVTLGGKIDHEVTRLSEQGNYSESFLIDAWGSALIEGAVQVVDSVIRKEASLLGLRAGKRRSPGYKPWDLSEQVKIFQMLNAEQIGVILTDSFTMQPRKSVTFGIPLFSAKTTD